MKIIICSYLLLYLSLTCLSQPPVNMIKIPEGRITIRIRHKNPRDVLIKSFYMDKYEVTIADFEKFVLATKYKTDSEKKGFSISIEDTIVGATWRCDSRGIKRPRNEYNRPVIHVSFNDAKHYAEWAKKRLPSEDEWIYVALQKKPKNIDSYAWFQENAKGKICSIEEYHNKKPSSLIVRMFGDKIHYLDVQPVGLKEPNIWGIYDLFGNAYEMTISTTSKRFPNILKGDCFWGFKEDFFGNEQIDRQCGGGEPNHTSEKMGFRCVKDIKQ